MYVIFFMILGSVISWVICLVLLRSNLGVVTVRRNSLEKEMLGVFFRVGHTWERRASVEKGRRVQRRASEEKRRCAREEPSLPPLFRFLEQREYNDYLFLKMECTVGCGFSCTSGQQ
jgi:hypothetical protein